MNITFRQNDFTFLSEKFLETDKQSRILYCDFNVLNYFFSTRIKLPKDIVLYPDSTAVYLVIKYLYRKNIKKMVSTDIQYQMLDVANQNSLKIFFFGDYEDVLNKLRVNLKRKYENIIIVGTQNGYNFDESQVLDRINSLKPDILFVGLGVGGQEEWICKNYQKINAKLAISVGGWFQYLAHKKKRSPKLIRVIHFEWLHKLFKRISESVETISYRYSFICL